MAGTTNIIPWNPTGANQETDAQYAADSQRAGGATDPSIFLSPLANKAFYQWSTYLTALFQAFANKNFTTSDSNLSTLTAQCANFLTTADIVPAQITVSYSPTPVFDGGAASGFRIALSGNVTSSTFINQIPGRIYTFFIVSNNPGVYTFAWPSLVSNPPDVQTESVGNLLTYQFISDGTNLYPLSTMLIVLQNLIDALQGDLTSLEAEVAALEAITMVSTDVTGSRSFGASFTASEKLLVNVTGEIAFGVGNTATIQAIVNGIRVATASITNSSGFTSISFPVPSGVAYQVNTGGIGPGDNHSATLTNWTETTKF